MKLLKKIFELKKESEFINDRREFKRYAVILKLNYSYLEVKYSYSGESLTKNISKNGIRFPVNAKLPKDSLLDIKIEDPNSDGYLLLKGRVRWLEEFSVEDDTSAVRYETGVNILKKRLF